MSTAEKSRHLLYDYWQDQIAAWGESGQTQKAFCEQHELNYHRFGYWRRKFQEPKPIDSKKGFVPVRQSPGRVTMGLTLILPNGVRIQGIESTNLQVVSQLLRQL